MLEALASDGQTDAVILLLEKDPSAASLAGPIESLARAGKETILFSTAGRGLRDPEELLQAAAGEVLAGNAVEALASLGSADAVPLLLERLNDEKAFVRRSAVAALLKIGSPDALEALERASRDDEDWEVRLYAAEALKQLGTR